MIDNYMLYSDLPSIDLHGMDRVFAIIKVKEFIMEDDCQIVCVDTK